LATASEGSAATNANSLKRTNFGISYDLGMAKPMLQYTQASFQPNAGAERKVQHVLLGVTAPVGPGIVKASYIRSNYDNFGGDANQFAVGYEYGLSKRTAVYGNYARINNKTGATFGLSPNAAPAANGGNATGYEFGVRHTF
jgi:predicted porin